MQYDLGVDDTPETRFSSRDANGSKVALQNVEDAQKPNQTHHDAAPSSTPEPLYSSLEINQCGLCLPSNLLQASPYPHKGHLLDLDTLSIPYGLFAKALANLRPIRQDYATAPYASSFNWDAIMDTYCQLLTAQQANGSVHGNGSTGCSLNQTSFFVIAFRSRLKPDADRVSLGELDRESHREAVASGGLLKYWFGVPNAEGRNLATCLWRNGADARQGGGGRGHAASVQAARRMYDVWDVERFALVIDSEKGSWTFRN